MLKFLSNMLIKAGSAIKPQNAKEILKEKGINSLEDLQKLTKKELFKKLNVKPKSLTKTAITAGTGAGATLGAQKFTGDVKEELEKSRMAGGGMVKKRAKTRTKKSRGTGAAIRGTKFKGVF
jgi:hypothetical protein